MIYLARKRGEGESIPLAQIAKDEKLSLAYLERLFALLKKAGIVAAEKGKSGGYLLCKDPEETDVFSIVKALEGNLVPFHCIDNQGNIKCAAKSKCGASSVLAGVYAAISKTLMDMKLSDLV